MMKTKKMQIEIMEIETLQALQDKGLIRLLKAIEPGSIATRRLFEKFSGNDLHRKLKEATERGFVTREKVKPEGKGNWLMVNRLTPKGKRLLQVANLL